MDKSIYSHNYGEMLKLLVAARLRAGLTQVEVALRLDETQTFISKCERGERRLDVAELRMWCGALGVSFTALTRDFDEVCLPLNDGVSGTPR
jgi:transcriptional regulator with XRE-family HTH domain